MPLYVHPRVQDISGQYLAVARQTLSALRDPDSLTSDGWSAQVETVYTRIYKLIAEHPISDAEAELFRVWHNQAREHLAKGVDDAWPLLVQYGVRELLYFLYQALCELFSRDAKDRALNMLVRALPSLTLENHR